MNEAHPTVDELVNYAVEKWPSFVRNHGKQRVEALARTVREAWLLELWKQRHKEST